jgi:hypothetical protein
MEGRTEWREEKERESQSPLRKEEESGTKYQRF